MNQKPTVGALALQYGILILACLFAFYPVWFAILASGRLGDRL
jgi:arabinogalactan oligomer/maltooligosaccharide transport system permease protein